jgi:hypothetical protein
MTASVPYSGFSSGQKIPIMIKYFNHSNVEVEQTKIRLKRVVTYTSHSPKTSKKVSTEMVVEKLSSGVATGEAIEIECCLEIPRSMMNSNADFCNIIRIKYYLEIEGVVTGCSANPQVKILITIGKIPIQLENEPLDNQLPPPFNQLVMTNYQEEELRKLDESKK